VDTSRRSKRSEPLRALLRAALTLGFAGAGVAGALACGAGQPPVTALAMPDASREPDGVVIEPVPAVPEAEERAPASGVVALRAPLPNEAVVAIVHRLFRALVREDVDALQSTLTDDATILGKPHGARGGERALLDVWRARLKSLDYTRLAGGELVQESTIARFTYDDLGAPGAPERPPEMKRGELLVRFAVPTPRVGTEQLFGDEMTLLLRRDGRGYKIAGIGEEGGP
jgi:hypothetical protein